MQALLASIDFSLPIPAPDTVTVEDSDGSWLLRFQRNGEPYPHQLDLCGGRNAFDPSSFVRFRAYQIDGEWIHELRLVQAPVAFTDTSAPDRAGRSLDFGGAGRRNRGRDRVE